MRSRLAYRAADIILRAAVIPRILWRGFYDGCCDNSPAVAALILPLLIIAFLLIIA